MYRKRIGPEWITSPAKRLKSEILDVFLSNAGSTSRVSRLASAAQEAGVPGLEDVVHRCREENSNKARDVTRMAIRYKKWPKLYEANLRGRKVANEDENLCRCSILLPHEFVYVLCQNNEMDILIAEQERQARKRPDLCKHPANDCLWLGLWQDGVPFNANREHSLECWSLSLLGCPDLRVPVSAWPRDLQVKRKTAEDFIAVLKWSMECLERNEMPSVRHNGQPFGDSDQWRRWRAGKPIGIRARLVEIRGDWSMFKSVLGLPGWQEGGCFCWKCNLKRSDLQEVGLMAAWRTDKLSHSDFMLRQGSDEKWTSTFFQIPHVDIDSVKIDWLHAADLGCTCDYLGNFFHYLTMNKVNGGQRHGSHQQRVEYFFNNDILAYYETHSIESRLPCLRPSMLKKDGGGFKLRAKGGEARSLVGILPTVIEKYLEEGLPLERAMGHTGQQLVKMYACLSESQWCPVEFEKSVVAFMKGLVWLERFFQRQDDRVSWRMKPKSHLLLELAREKTNPIHTWCYRDESWGGHMAELGRRSGGAFTMSAISKQLLLRFIAREPFPRL